MGVEKNVIINQYNCTPMEYLNNSCLTAKERGIVTTLYALPDDWKFSIHGFTKLFPEGKESISQGLSSLREKGYVEFRQKRGKNSHYGQTDAILWLPPLPRQPNMKWRSRKRGYINRDTVNRDTVNRDTSIQDPRKPPESITNESIINESIIKESINKESYNTLESRAKETPLEKPEEEPEKGTITEDSDPPDSLLYVDEPQYVQRNNRFNNFKQRRYNFNYLEKQIFQAQKRPSEADEEPASFNGQK